MRLSPTTLLIISAALLSGCVAAPQVEPRQTPPQKVVLVPVYVVPNCGLPKAGACQWIEPPAQGNTQHPAPQRVNGIAL